MLKEVSIEIIRKCPNRCIHCSSMSSPECTEIIAYDTFRKVVEGAANLHLKTLCFSGGEPFLHPNIVEMVKYTADKGMQSYIYTSGIYIDGDNIRSSIPNNILSQIKETVTKLIFNIEAVSEDMYNRIMGTQGCLPYLRQSILDAVNMGIVCEAHFVPMKLNMGEIERTVQFCENIGISKVSFLRLVLHGRALLNKDFILLNEGELDSIKNKLKTLQNNGKLSVRIGVPLSDVTAEKHCEAAVGKLNIKYDGHVYPCEVFKNAQNRKAGDSAPDNIYDKDIEDIYYHSDYLNHIRDYIADFCPYNNCENCAGQYYIQSL